MSDKMLIPFTGEQLPTGENNFIDGLNKIADSGNYAVDYLDFFVGSTLDEPRVVITSDGVNITLELDKAGGGDIRYRVNGETKILDCTPAASVTLTPGTDSLPADNHVYIAHDTGLLTANTTGFPAAPYTPIGEYYARTAVFHQTRGLLGKNHRNHVFTPGNNGHMGHINSARRKQPCIFENGLLLTAAGSGTAVVNFALSAGQIYRMHSHDVLGVSSPAEFFIHNDEVSADAVGDNLHSIETYSDGSTNLNEYCIYIIYIAHLDETTGIFLNKPSAGYNAESEAYTDPDETANWAIPAPYAGASIYVGRVVARRTASATTVYQINTDVRSLAPSAIAGGGLSGVPDHASGHLPGGDDQLFNQSLNDTDTVDFAGLSLGGGASKDGIEETFVGGSSKLITAYAVGQEIATREPVFAKNTAFNKNFGNASGTVCAGDDQRLNGLETASTTPVSVTGGLVVDLDGPGLQIITTTNAITLTLSTSNRPTAGYWKKKSLRIKPSGNDITLVYPTGYKILKDSTVDTTVTAGTELAVVISAEGANESDVVWSTSIIEAG